MFIQICWFNYLPAASVAQQMLLFVVNKMGFLSEPLLTYITFIGFIQGRSEAV
jgi:hypothetical protein